VEEVTEILGRRDVRFVLIDDIQDAREPDKLAVIANSEKIIGRPGPKEPFGELLGTARKSSQKNVPAFLRYVTPEERGLVYKLSVDPDKQDPALELRFYRQQFLHLYVVDPTKL
jgi:hypothetical protein